MKNKRFQHPLSSGEVEEESICLCLPNSISNANEFCATIVRNTTFESIGLKKGLVALAVIVKIQSGDLVAFEELKSDTCIIGYYSALGNLICLEDFYGDVEIFNENELKFRGKVIGHFKMPDNRITQTADVYIISNRFLNKGVKQNA